MPPTNFDNLREQKSRLGILAAGVSDRDLIGLDKMGFTELRGQGQPFRAAMNEHRNLKAVMEEIGNRAVPVGENGRPLTTGGQPRATEYDGLMAAVGQAYRRDPDIFDKLSRDFEENPRLEAQFMQAVERNPSAVAQSLTNYRGQNGYIEGVMSSILTPAQPQPIQSSPILAGGPPTPAPVQAVTAAVPAQPVPEETLAELPQTSAVTLTASDIVGADGLVEGLSAKLKSVFPDLENEIDTFSAQIRNDPALQERIAQNLNNNPEFVARLAQFQNADGQPNANADNLLRQFGRQSVVDLLAHPDKLADDQYVDGLNRQLGMASGGMGGMLAGVGDFFKNMFSGGGAGGGFFAGIGEFFQNLMAGMQGGNFMAMFGGPGNEGGSLIDRLTNGMGNVMREGRFQNAFTGNGEFARFGLVTIDPATGRANHPEFRQQQPDGTFISVNADGTPVQPPTQPPAVRMAAGAPNSTQELNANGPANGPAAPPLAAS